MALHFQSLERFLKSLLLLLTLIVPRLLDWSKRPLDYAPETRRYPFPLSILPIVLAHLELIDLDIPDRHTGP